MTTATLTDTDVRLRDAVMTQLDWDPEVDATAIGVAAKNGTVTLTGFIDTYAGVANHITAAPKAAVRDVRSRIARALHQNADVDARQITVIVSGDCATLTGTAGTWLQRDAAERAAASAPGLARVDNRIVVQSFHDAKTDDWDEMC